MKRFDDRRGLPPLVRRNHSITSGSLVLLLVGAMILIIMSGALKPPVDTSALSSSQLVEARKSNLRAALSSTVAAYLLYSAIQGPETHMIRSHPAVWKIIHGMFVLYLLFLVFLLCQDTYDARAVLKFLSPDLLDADADERAYGEDCRIYTPEDPVSNFRVLRDTVCDEFVIAHVIGWYGKAIVLRSVPLLWCYSVAFELLEITFQHWLKNFNECWWDAWILDVALCNAVGIYFGMMTIKFWEGADYDWTGKKGISGQVQRSLSVLAPASVDAYSWNPTSSPLRFLQCAFIVVVCLIFELNAFLLKYVFSVPPSNILNIVRLGLWFGIANVATREYFVFITSSRGMRTTKLGSNAWLAIAVALVEVLVTVKHGRDMFTAPWPRRVVVFWSVVGSAVAGWLVHWQLRLNRHRSFVREKRE